MSTILISIAAAIIHNLAIAGYLSILWGINIHSSETRQREFANLFIRVILFVLGAGSLFFAPAYLYGQFKTQITEEMFVSFTVAEIIAVIALVVFVKSWSALFKRDTGKK